MVTPAVESLTNNSIKILWVEDDPVFVFVTKRLLEKRGIHITWNVSACDDALNICQNEKPDIIIMDVSLQGNRNGIETAKLIRCIHKCPIIFFTQVSDPDLMSAAQSFENSAVLEKSDKIISLFRQIKKITALN